jgi:hypothetical protein
VPEAYNYAAEIKLRSYRHLGEILKDTPKNGGTKGTIRGSTDGSGGAILVPPESQPPTLAEVGLTKKQSSKAQKIADVLYDSRYDLFSACNARTVNNSDYRQ